MKYAKIRKNSKEEKVKKIIILGILIGTFLYGENSEMQERSINPVKKKIITSETVKKKEDIMKKTEGEKKLENEYMNWRIGAYERVNRDINNKKADKSRMRALMDIDMALVEFIQAKDYRTYIDSSYKISKAYEGYKKYFKNKKIRNEYELMLEMFKTF